MKTMRLDISNDIFDKVMYFLENLPKNKVKIQIQESNSFKDKTFNPKDFFAVANSSKLEIDEYLNKKLR
ncbi:hypothetical protein MNB_SV-13-608 [hydrothermal vent metagenome]|uniref:Uncharacterized protein n=1 Tax=hydrothermal vent metagenome TaxID=652676 RepID=A0A1W1CK89_9ZZZZ